MDLPDQLAGGEKQHTTVDLKPIKFVVKITLQLFSTVDCWHCVG